MVTKEIREVVFYIASDGTDFCELNYQTEEDAKAEAERYDAQFANPVDRTFSHGFVMGDLVYYADDDKLYRVEITKVDKIVKTQWIEYDPNVKPYYNRENWHHNEPAMLDVITVKILATGEEETVYGDFIKVTIKKTIEEFIV